MMLFGLPLMCVTFNHRTSHLHTHTFRLIYLNFSVHSLVHHLAFYFNSFRAQWNSLRLFFWKIALSLSRHLPCSLSDSFFSSLFIVSISPRFSLKHSKSSPCIFDCNYGVNRTPNISTVRLPVRIFLQLLL